MVLQSADIGTTRFFTAEKYFLDVMKWVSLAMSAESNTMIFQ
jgi:hypothetical protein